MTENNRFDVIIICGSYAGFSAAMALGRSLRNVLVIDSGNPGFHQHEISIGRAGRNNWERIVFFGDRNS